MCKKKKNELVDIAKIRNLAATKYKTLENFGKSVLNIDKRQLVFARLSNKSRLTADELFMIADDFGITADDLRLKP